MREKIAELKKKQKVNFSTISNQDKSLRHIQEKYDELIRELRSWWRFNILSDPEIMNEIGPHLPPYYRVIKYEPFSVKPSDYLEASLPAMDRLHYETLEAVHIASRIDHENLAMHLMLSVGSGEDKRLGYYVTKEMFHQYKHVPAAVARSITDAMMHEIAKWFTGRI